MKLHSIWYRNRGFLIAAGKRHGWGLKPHLFDSRDSVPLSRASFSSLTWNHSMQTLESLHLVACLNTCCFRAAGWGHVRNPLRLG